MLTADYSACLVIAGCQSLVLVNKELVGDPLETACIHAIGWRYSSDDNLAKPLQVSFYLSYPWLYWLHLSYHDFRPVANGNACLCGLCTGTSRHFSQFMVCQG